jgi:hypothetical protein
MDGNRINAKAAIFLREVEYKYFCRSWITLTYKIRDKKMELMMLWFLKVLHYVMFFTL